MYFLFVPNIIYKIIIAYYVYLIKYSLTYLALFNYVIDFITLYLCILFCVSSRADTELFIYNKTGVLYYKSRSNIQSYTYNIVCYNIIGHAC